jgi:hypothetical protein
MLYEMEGYIIDTSTHNWYINTDWILTFLHPTLLLVYYGNHIPGPHKNDLKSETNNIYIMEMPILGLMIPKKNAAVYNEITIFCMKWRVQHGTKF